jgi:hypothetical protein
MKLILEQGDILPQYHTHAPDGVQFHMLTKTAKEFVREIGSAIFEGRELNAPFRVRYWDFIVYGGYSEHFREIDTADAEIAIKQAKELIADLNKRSGPLSGRMSKERYGLIEVLRGKVSHWRSWGTDGSIQKAA